MAITLNNKSILYIDPNLSYASTISNALFPDVASKSQTRNTLEQSKGYFDAIRRIKGKSEEVERLRSSTAQKVGAIIAKNYDIILCEYELGDSRTAQEFLEEIRRRKLIPLSTIFIMITAERISDRVISVLEFAPDAYILKTENTPEQVERRVAEAIRDREELLPIFIQIDRKDYAEALRLCNEYLSGGGRLTKKVKRLRSQVYFELRDYENARKSYEEILDVDVASGKKDSSAFAKDGLARSLFQLGKKTEAEDMLRQVTEEHPEYMQGYDSLSELLLGTGRGAEAQAVMQQAVDRSPRRFDRQQLLALTAIENEDFETSRDALLKVTRDGKYMSTNHPSNYALLAESQLELGNFDDAMKALKEASNHFAKTEHAKPAEFCNATMEHAIHSKKGDTKRADEALKKAVAIHQSGESDFASVNERLQASFAVQCFEGGHAEVAEQALEIALQNSTKGAETVRKVAKKKLAGNPAALDRISAATDKAVKSLTQTLDSALNLFKSGSREQALGIMEAMVAESPNNPEILAKAAQIILMHLDQSGFDKVRFDEADEFISRIQKIEPESKHVRVLHLLTDRVRKKYKQDAIP
ncbi:MAG: hypothetical protein QG650_416, partial [Patescibacteria group bacterium]|nr:hypothetical protein [Patescibacteria group bacterium]